MSPNPHRIQSIQVVSNTHWDREFRRSFEKTRRRLLTMMDTTLGILASDPDYHSFTMDGHSIMIDDYLEMRPEQRELVEKLVGDGRLVIGPYYTLAEEFSIGQESLVRNLLWGRRQMQKYGSPPVSVAYTPSSWGQTGQLPQILRDFGCDKMMFYRGISHHEADAEWVWQAPDGTQVLASRFAVYARYNWYYQVHRPVTTGRVFGKDYVWGEFDEVPVRIADGLAGEDLAFDLQAPAVLYHPERLKEAIEAMVAREGEHFTTPVFLAMHGHDISVAHPLESRIIRDAREQLAGKVEIEHTDLEGFWKKAEPYLNRDKLPVLTGERRSYLKQGMWTFLFPGTISARTYLKLRDFAATAKLVEYGEPLAALGTALGLEYPRRYLDRGWQYLLSNHTHDANGGCAPDAVCQDMEYRYRKVSDIGDIVTEDVMAHVAKNLAPADDPADALQVLVFNSLPQTRDEVVLIDLEVPRAMKAVTLEDDQGRRPPLQMIDAETSSSFVDSIWEVPRILESNRIRFYARLTDLPSLGYTRYRVRPLEQTPRHRDSLLTGTRTMQNEHLAVRVNDNGTVDLTCRTTGRRYGGLNYLLDQGETGNAWKHVAPRKDRRYDSQSVAARVQVVEEGPLVTVIRAEYDFPVPADYGDGTTRSEALVDLPVRIDYRLEAGSPCLKVALTVDNRARDHWLRACCPTDLGTDVSVADTHFDVIERPIPLPDSTGWVEEAFGTHPLQTFADLCDGNDGFAVLSQGLFEFEAMDTPERTLALTLIRACRIKLAVSEEKMTELPDDGVQCPGRQTFRYALMPHAGSWQEADLPGAARCSAHPVRAILSGRGQGNLPGRFSLLQVDNPQVRISAIKQSEDETSLVVRAYNPTDAEQKATLRLGAALAGAAQLRMDESAVADLPVAKDAVTFTLAPRKIVTLGLSLKG